MKRDWKEKVIMEQFMENYSEFYRMAYAYTKNEEDAMDIVQESACKALVAQGSLKSEQYVRTWIYSIVIHTALDLLRKKKREVVGIENKDGYENGSIDKNYEEVEVMEWLGRLKETDRSVLILRYFEDMKIEDIAKVMDENVSTIKSRLYRALKQLRLQL